MPSTIRRLSHAPASRTRAALSAALAACAFALPAPAVAEYPEQPIRVVVAIAAGSVTDVIARASAAELAPRLGQQLVIENRGGANGIPAAEACKSARPDGYTICLLNHGHFSFNPLQFDNLRGPRYHVVDATISKEFSITERVRTELKMAAYNALNVRHYQSDSFHALMSCSPHWWWTVSAAASAAVALRAPSELPSR